MKNVFALLSLILLTAGCTPSEAPAPATEEEPAPAVEPEPKAEAEPADASATAPTASTASAAKSTEEGDHSDHHATHTETSAKDLEIASNARVFFVAPQDKATVSSPVQVKMGVEGMTVQPAGELKAGTGHHHIIIDGQALKAGAVVPADATHIHYGKGQTETTLDLTPGTHTLTMQFANGAHQSYGPGLSSTITVTVE